MTWLCLRKTKNEVNLLFQNFHKMIETQYNTKLWVLRSDNSGEYQSSNLRKYMEGHDIIHQTMCSNTPMQNGVAERKTSPIVRGLSFFNNKTKANILFRKSSYVFRILY